MVILDEGGFNPDIWPETPIQGTGTEDMIAQHSTKRL